MPLFKRFRAPKPTFTGPLRPETPFFAVGDLHGRLDLLDKMIAHMERVAPAIPWVFVGDYIDRGEQSAQVLQRLQALQTAEPDRVICLKGNHEEMLLDVLDGSGRNAPRWLRNGGLQTLASFQVPLPSGSPPSAEDWQQLRDRLAAALGADLMDWLRDRPLIWRSGNVAVTHAGADPDLPIGAQPARTLLWGHPEFEARPRQDGQWVAHGHIIKSDVNVENGRIALDTGAYASGVLSAALITAEAVHFYST